MSDNEELKERAKDVLGDMIATHHGKYADITSDLLAALEAADREQKEAESVLFGNGPIICGEGKTHAKETIPFGRCLYCLVEALQAKNAKWLEQGNGFKEAWQSNLKELKECQAKNARYRKTLKAIASGQYSAAGAKDIAAATIEEVQG